MNELEENVDQSLYCALNVLAKFGNCSNNAIIGRLKDFSYKSMWINLIYHNMSPNHDHESLQIVNLLRDRSHHCSLIDQILTDKHVRILCHNYRNKRAYLKPHDYVQRPTLSRCGLKPFLCIFWNSSGVLHDTLLEKSKTETSNAFNHSHC